MPSARGARTSALATTVAVLALLGAPPLHTGANGAPRGATADVEGWREILDATIEASRTTAFSARMAIVSFSPRGPSLAEVSLAQGSDGAVTVGRAEAWMVGRGDGKAFFWQPQAGRAGATAAPLAGAGGDAEARRAGTLLSLGAVERTELSVAALVGKYRVELAGQRELTTGLTDVLVISERATGHERERLFIDRRTDLVVRRETLDADSTPDRLVALTDLDVSEPGSEMLTAPDGATETSPADVRTALAASDLDRLARDGWAVPETLGAGYRLLGGFTVPAPCITCDGATTSRSSLHLLYSDGLYTVSLYEQRGRVADAALDGAVVVSHDDTYVHRWPGSEPERMVWSGAGRTFTVVSDAPHREVLAAISVLPSDPPPGLAGRIGRGLSRIAGWLWPF